MSSERHDVGPPVVPLPESRGGYRVRQGRLIAVAAASLAVSIGLTSGSERASETPNLDRSARTSFQEGDRNFRVSIAAPERVAIGEEFVVTVSIANRADRPLAVHPSLDDLSGRFAALALFDAGGNYLGDLLAPTDWTSVVNGTSPFEWCEIPAKEVYVIRRQFVGGAVGGTRHEPPGPPLPPGRYEVQMIFDRRFFSESPWGGPYHECGCDTASREYKEFVRDRELLLQAAALRGEGGRDAVARWREAYRPGELVRSNVATIRLGPPTDAE